MKRLVRRAALGLAVIGLGALTGLVATPQPAAAALPNCTSGVWVQQLFGDFAWRYLPLFGRSWDCLLARGNQGPAVVALQNTLIKCYSQPISRDGIFGAKTETALRMAQTWERVANHKNIAIDGKYGPQTRAAILWPAYPGTRSLDAPLMPQNRCRSLEVSAPY
jgi:hypothetical protein